MLSRKLASLLACAFITVGAGVGGHAAFARHGAFPPRSDSCPLVLLGGSAKQNSIRVHIKNTTDDEITGFRLNCKLVDAEMDKSYHASCIEENARVGPHSETTTVYTFEEDLPGPILVSVNTVAFAGGKSWKPNERDGCETLKLIPGK